MFSFDFSKGMTQYELLAIILSVIALAHPLIKFLWLKYIVKSELEYLPFGQIHFYFNQSGSYLQLSFVLSCKNKSAIINNIRVNVLRKSNNESLELDWSSFMSVYNQRVGDSPIITNETARPFRIDRNNLYPLIIQFYIADNDTMNKFERIHTDMLSELTKYPYEFTDTALAAALEKLRESDKYKKYYPQIEEELFWKKGEYILEIITSYNDKYQYKSISNFTITHDEANSIKNNIDESLICKLKNKFYSSANFYTIYKDFRNIKVQ